MAGASDPCPLHFPHQYLLPSKADGKKIEYNKQKAIDVYKDKWQIKNWLNLNDRLDMPIEKWVGNDWFMERFGIDEVLSNVIAVAIEEKDMEAKHQQSSPSNHTQEMESPELRFPKKL